MLWKIILWVTFHSLCICHILQRTFYNHSNRSVSTEKKKKINAALTTDRFQVSNKKASVDTQPKCGRRCVLRPWLCRAPAHCLWFSRALHSSASQQLPAPCHLLSAYMARSFEQTPSSWTTNTRGQRWGSSSGTFPLTRSQKCANGRGGNPDAPHDSIPITKPF